MFSISTQQTSVAHICLRAEQKEICMFHLRWRGYQRVYMSTVTHAQKDKDGIQVNAAANRCDHEQCTQSFAMKNQAEVFNVVLDPPSNYILCGTNSRVDQTAHTKEQCCPILCPNKTSKLCLQGVEPEGKLYLQD